MHKQIKVEWEMHSQAQEITSLAWESFRNHFLTYVLQQKNYHIVWSITMGAFTRAINATEYSVALTEPEYTNPEPEYTNPDITV